jgi:hypothetical protein
MWKTIGARKENMRIARAGSLDCPQKQARESLGLPFKLLKILYFYGLSAPKVVQRARPYA